MSQLTKSQAALLSPAALGTGQDETLRILKTASADELADMILGLVNLCNSVIANHDTMARTMVDVFGGTHPNQSEKINMPDLPGALTGIVMASAVDQEKTCETCAFRLGSIPNQSSSTMSDVLSCVDGEDDFMCHETIGEDGECGRTCKGYAQLLKVKTA